MLRVCQSEKTNITLTSSIYNLIGDYNKSRLGNAGCTNNNHLKFKESYSNLL